MEQNVETEREIAVTWMVIGEDVLYEHWTE